MGRPTCFQEACWQRKGEKQEWWGVGQDQGRPFVSYDPEVFVNREEAVERQGLPVPMPEAGSRPSRSREEGQDLEREGG